MTVDKMDIESLFSEKEISQVISDLENDVFHAPPCDCPSCEYWIYKKFTKSKFGKRFDKSVFILWWIEKRIRSRYPNLKKIFIESAFIELLDIIDEKSNGEYELFDKFEEIHRRLQRLKKSKIIEKNTWKSTWQEFSLAQKIADKIKKKGEISRREIERMIQKNNKRPVKVESISEVDNLALTQNVLIDKKEEGKRIIYSFQQKR